MNKGADSIDGSPATVKRESKRSEKQTALLQAVETGEAISREAGSRSPGKVGWRGGNFHANIHTDMAMVSRQSIKKAVGGALKAGQKVGYGKIQKVMGAAGVNLRYKGSVKDYQATAAFRKLKEAKVLSGRAESAGAKAFMRAVRKAEAPVGPTKEQVAGRAKVALRKRLTEEAAEKLEITKALKGGRSEAAPERRAVPARAPEVQSVSLPGTRGAPPPARDLETPAAKQPEAEPSTSPVEEEEGPAIPSADDAKDLPLD